MLNAMPTIESAMAAVATRQYSHPSTCNSPMTFLRRTSSINSTMTGGASTPLTTAPLERLDRIESCKINADADQHAECEHGIEGNGPLRLA
jgi:hypothetical protein